MANRQKWMFPKQRTCKCCSQGFERGDDRLLTIYPTIYMKSAPDRAMNVGEGIRICQPCLGVVLATPASREGKTVSLAIYTSLSANYKKLKEAEAEAIELRKEQEKAEAQAAGASL